MNFHTFPLFAKVLAPACTLLLSGCAAPEGYPSLNTRDSERVSGTFAPPPTTQFTPPPITNATIEQLGELGQSARVADAEFQAGIDGARAAIAGLSGAATGSLNWSEGQVTIAALESSRANTLIALAEIDRLFVEAALQGARLDGITTVQDEVSNLIKEQDAIIDSLRAALEQ